MYVGITLVTVTWWFVTKAVCSFMTKGVLIAPLPGEL